MVTTFAALAEPNRYRIVELLRGGARPVNDIGARLGLNQPQVSKHLKVLKAAGLVEVEQRAQQRVYDLRGEGLRELHAWLDRYREFWEERYELLDGVLEDLKQADRKTPKVRKR